MFTIQILLASNPFSSAWLQSDFIGRFIFLMLFALSLISWTVFFYKWWIASRVRQESRTFKKIFSENRATPLTISYARKTHPETPNAFYILYEVLQKKTEEILKKNITGTEVLAPADISLLEREAMSTISMITRYLERHLYLLSTIVTLAPFLGLLGTVYGILITFSETAIGSLGNTQILSGLSLALTTTVLGLINAIPALIGYSYLKNSIADFDHEMERFATEILSTVTLHYRTTEA